MPPIFLTNGPDDRSYATVNDPLEIYGLDGDDTILGGNNSDYIDGGNDNDTIRDVGGLGNDHFLGQAGNDQLYAIAGNDWLEGGEGNDILSDSSGLNVLDGGAGNDVISGGKDADTLLGGTGQDTFDGGDGDDVIYADGSAADGTDIIFGGYGDDTYILYGTNVKFKNQDLGVDTVKCTVTFSLYAASAEIENLTLIGGDAIDGTGNDLDNTLNGNEAANVLNGGAGKDTVKGFGGNDTLIGDLVYDDLLYGGKGDDTYIIYRPGTLTSEAKDEGIDTVQLESGITIGSYTLAANIENLVITGTFGTNGFGNELSNTITGNGARNELNGGAGLDALYGGGGDDTYYLYDISRSPFVDGGGSQNKYFYDTVFEADGQGFDTVYISSNAGVGNSKAPTSYTLTPYVEVGIILDGQAFDLTGNAQANKLVGNDQANVLNGSDGADVLYGNAGFDTLLGGTGDDTFYLNDLSAVPDGFGHIAYLYDTVVEDSKAGVDTVSLNSEAQSEGQYGGGYTLTANVENAVVTGIAGFTLVGNELDNKLTGNGVENTIFGGGGADTLDGGAGFAFGHDIDQLIGGTGDDQYYLGTDYSFDIDDYVWDGVTEDENAGNDTVYLRVTDLLSYTLGANVENGVILGSAAFSLTGNGLANVLTSNSGKDTLKGGLGNDTYIVNNASDVIIEGKDEGAADIVRTSVSYTLGAGVYVENLQTTSDVGTGLINLTGNEFAQTIIGNAVGNLLDGKGGADTMQGGNGNDTYRVDNAGDVIVEGKDEGTADVVLSSVSYTLGKGVYVEFLQTNSTAGSAAINLVGNELSQTIVGNAGINTLTDGGGVGDVLKGLGGNDIYRVASAATTIVEGKDEGTTDIVLASTSFTLGKGAYLEFLQTNSTAGTTAINLTGNELSQTIVGNAAINNLSDGGGTGDVLRGLGGNDIYRVASAATTIVEGASEGTADVVLASVSFKLNAGAYVEFLQTNSTAGTGTINLTGNELAQTLVGNAGANRLDGKGGADTLTGRDGKDTFVFSTALNLGVDTITDFKAVDDTIELSKAVFTALSLGTLSTSAFRANTTGLAGDASDRIIYETDTGKLFYDADGTGTGATGIHFATLAGLPTITNADFVVA